MKTLVALLTLTMASCAHNRAEHGQTAIGSEEARYIILAGLRWRPDAEYFQGGERRHPVYEALKKAGIDCSLGDHAARMTVLHCLEADAPQARALIDDLPEEQRGLVYLQN